jgi:hypothetical protein
MIAKKSAYWGGDLEYGRGKGLFMGIRPAHH